ncbi:MAG: glutamate--tRNA ligase, partial [Verrucomicrobia bacterium]|nr:glutamate--tRNA ligase [Cytophagales bacterium]
ERAEFPQDFEKDSYFFFHTPQQYDENMVTQKWNAEAATIIEAFKDAIPEISDFTHEIIKAKLSEVLDKFGMKIGKIMSALRLVITGVNVGPDLMHTMEIIGKEETTLRINNALQKLKLP